MKKPFLLLPLLIAALACTSADAPAPFETEPPAVRAIEDTLFPETPTAAVPSAAEAPTDTPEPIDTPAPTAPESLHLNNVTASGALAEPLPLEVTVREFDWSKANPEGDYETKYRKETIDFAGLRISLDALDADKTHTRLRLHVRHPESWTKLQSQNINGWFLHFTVLLDGEQAPFVLKAKSVQLGFDTQNERCDDYVIVLESKTVNMHTLAAYNELTVLPFLLTHEWRAVGNQWRTDPDGTDVATTLTRPHFALGPRRTDLSAFALSVDLAAVCAGIEPQPIPQREPVMRTVTIFREDIQRNLDEECYTREGENIPRYGYYENVTADFSGIRIYVDQFQVTDLNILMLARIELPEEWTPEQTWLFGRRPLDFYFLIDGNNAAGRAFYGIRDFTMHSYPGLHRIPTSVDDPKNFTVKTLYCMIYASRQYADAILNAKELCIVPVLRHDRKLRVHGKVYDLDREPTPYDANLTYDVLEWSRDPVWELAVYIDPGTLIVSKEVD